MIAWWKEKPISFRKLGEIGCFAVVTCHLEQPILQKLIDAMKSLGWNFHHFLLTRFDRLPKQSLYKWQWQCCSWRHTWLASYFLSSAELYHLTWMDEGFSCHNLFLEVLSSSFSFSGFFIVIDNSFYCRLRNAKFPCSIYLLSYLYPIKTSF